MLNSTEITVSFKSRYNFENDWWQHEILPSGEKNAEKRPMLFVSLVGFSFSFVQRAAAHATTENVSLYSDDSQFGFEQIIIITIKRSNKIQNQNDLGFFLFLPFYFAVSCGDYASHIPNKMDFNVVCCLVAWRQWLLYFSIAKQITSRVDSYQIVFFSLHTYSHIYTHTNKNKSLVFIIEQWNVLTKQN